MRFQVGVKTKREGQTDRGHCYMSRASGAAGDKKLTKGEIRSVRTLLRITHLAHRKSYLVIICPNSHETLTKSEIRSSSSRFEHCSESLIQPKGSHIWSLVFICGGFHINNRTGPISDLASQLSSYPYQSTYKIWKQSDKDFLSCRENDEMSVDTA